MPKWKELTLHHSYEPRSAWLFAKLWKLKQTGRDQLDRARELQKIKEESAAVSLTEAFGESAPQLLLQLTIVLANGRFAGEEDTIGLCFHPEKGSRR